MTNNTTSGMWVRFAACHADQILGQTEVTSWISSQIRKRKHAHGLFCGPTGVGKSRAAEIYARQILCEEEIGVRPCGSCSACCSFRDKGRHEAHRRINCKDPMSLADFKSEIEKVERGSIWCPRHVLVLEEAHRLGNARYDALLVPLEREPIKTTVIITTTEPDRIPETVQDRFGLVRFRSISDECAFDAICRFLRSEDVKFDVDAVYNLVSTSKGSLRRSLSRIDVIYDIHGEVPSSSELPHSDVVDCNAAATTIVAILNEDRAKAFQTIDGWPCAPSKKLDTIQRLFFHLRLTKLQCLHPEDILMRSLAASDADAIASRVAEIAKVRSLGEQTLWQDATKHFDPETATTNTSLKAKLDRFCELLN